MKGGIVLGFGDVLSILKIWIWFSVVWLEIRMVKVYIRKFIFIWGLY